MQLIAHTFSLTYNDRASLSSKPSLQELVHAEHLLKYGGDAAGYVDVNILQALRSITQDQSRAFKVYKNKCHVQGDINLLATVVANVALALHALLASGWKPCTALKGDAKEQLLGGTKAQIQEELQAALKSIVDKWVPLLFTACDGRENVLHRRYHECNYQNQEFILRFWRLLLTV